MTNERFMEDYWPTHLVDPEIMFTDEGQDQAERLVSPPKAPKRDIPKGRIIFVYCDMERHDECTEPENPINICICQCGHPNAKGGPTMNREASVESR